MEASIFKKLLVRRRTQYRNLFLTDDGELNYAAEAVLADLKVFCRADRSSFTKGDPHATSLLEGRREVWNRIQEYLNMEESSIRSLAEKLPY